MIHTQIELRESIFLLLKFGVDRHKPSYRVRRHFLSAPLASFVILSAIVICWGEETEASIIEIGLFILETKAVDLSRTEFFVDLL